MPLQLKNNCHSPQLLLLKNDCHSPLQLQLKKSKPITPGTGFIPFIYSVVLCIIPCGHNSKQYERSAEKKPEP
ncbi:hypothetical protein SAMN05192574_106136 [Mucilaginibacter gossypiicola]|uniref:Uncharacterized protein n=1 Tax=Mucilaginibacter gossypiicola TaxID=551995 RepID=A0A1H8MXT0_9SPHI|nr:hypothetical protein SAMN05192574_106136 [Mucilaginibacter gossypiicola]